MSTKPNAKRSYRLRSYVICELCERRAFGEVHKGITYYRCSPNTKHHAHLPWFAAHPRAAYIREDLLTDRLEDFFQRRVFGNARQTLLTAAAANHDRQAADEAAKRAARLSAHPNDNELTVRITITPGSVPHISNAVSAIQGGDRHIEVAGSGPYGLLPAGRQPAKTRNEFGNFCMTLAAHQH